ncbi:hypothetical protein [Pontiella sulfatireligans]|uniref:Uncharacterized protein n=1 Tax=Pontiella sulfatireligans TaxID=2750658 RepID=A0A6C2URU2_9BACT|nr:hypothetical protein [Pontiella sulfatireligans]VGO23060.1 hypothetical protein SCARR_05159 [Pontiella sulfatireligans]
MKKKLIVGLSIVLAGVVMNSWSDFVNSVGSLTDSNNWSKGVFDNTENPAAGTSTDDASDFVAGNRTMTMSSDFATFDRFSMGTDGGTGSPNVTGGDLASLSRPRDSSR